MHTILEVTTVSVQTPNKLQERSASVWQARGRLVFSFGSDECSDKSNSREKWFISADNSRVHTVHHGGEVKVTGAWSGCSHNHNQKTAGNARHRSVHFLSPLHRPRGCSHPVKIIRPTSNDVCNQDNPPQPWPDTSPIDSRFCQLTTLLQVLFLRWHPLSWSGPLTGLGLSQ